MITQEYLKECLSYDETTGNFTWIERPSHHFNSNVVKRQCNSKHAGKKAGTIGTKGYIQIMVGSRLYEGHRLAWLFVYGVFPQNQIDHIDGDRAFNAIVNLRDVTHAENGKNQKLKKNNTSGKTGVYWYNQTSKWLAQIGSGDKRIHLGYFDIFEDAVIAREAAEIEHGFHKNHGRIT
jgi:hypothetical protein